MNFSHVNYDGLGNDKLAGENEDEDENDDTILINGITETIHNINF